jgi:hypothetical protein
MKKAFVALFVCSSLVSACGSNHSGSTAALDKTFNYGAPQAPSATEQTAVTTAQTTLSQTTTFTGKPDASTALLIVSFAETLAATALGATPVGLRTGNDPRALAKDDFSTCATVTQTSVTFTNCTESSNGFGFTLNGNITSTAGGVNWGTTGNFTASESGTSFNLNTQDTGNFAVGATSVSGNALSSYGGSVSVNGQSASFGISTALVVSLNFQTTPTYCITSGSLEIKRVWTQVPNGASGPEFADAATKLTWTGCGTVTVQHST